MGDVKTGDFVAAIYSISKELEECQSQIYNAFIYNKPSFLDEADTVTKRVIDNEERLTTELLAACGKDEKARRYCTVPTNLGRIAFNFGIISRAVRTKIKEDLLLATRQSLKSIFSSTGQRRSSIPSVISSLQGTHTRQTT